MLQGALATPLSRIIGLPRRRAHLRNIDESAPVALFLEGGGDKGSHGLAHIQSSDVLLTLIRRVIQHVAVEFVAY